MKCVTDCRADQAFIDDPQLRGLKLCRDFEYYINPDSTEIVELGTKLYPFK
jgi:hypothetical protein